MVENKKNNEQKQKNTPSALEAAQVKLETAQQRYAELIAASKQPIRIAAAKDETPEQAASRRANVESQIAARDEELKAALAAKRTAAAAVEAVQSGRPVPENLAEAK